ncbi:MAG: two-component regulator propeller domain-containing protein [Balneolaceae bacterium]
MSYIKNWFYIGAILLLITTKDSYGYQSSIVHGLDSLTAKSWTLEDGLPVNAINEIVQDEEGYLWITTYDGLVRFDGLNFKTYNFSNTPELRQNRTTQIYVQPGVGLWVALENGGVVLKKGNTFKYFGLEEGFSNSDITKIYEDHKKRVLFVTLDGIHIYENNKFRKFYEGDNHTQNQIVSEFHDPIDGSLWLATNGGLMHIVDNKAVLINYRSPPKDKKVYTVTRDESGLLIVGTNNGVYELQENVLIPSTSYLKFSNHVVRDIHVDEYSTLINTDEGLFLKTETNYISLLERYEPKDVFIQKFYRDSHGVLWMIDNRGDLFTLQGNEFKNYTENSRIEGLLLRSIFEDRERNLWIATLQHGLIRLKKSKAKVLGANEGLSGDNILALKEDSKGRYWVGTRGDGLNIIDGNKITPIKIKDGLETNIIHAIAEDSTGNIWIGNAQFGLDKWSNGKITHFNLAGGLDANDIRALYVSRDSSIWAGTYAGLIRFNHTFTDLKRYDLSDGMEGEKIRYITEDKEGNIWAASIEGGVSKLKDGVFTNYTMAEGLSSNNVRSLYIDEDETVWVGTENNGLNRIQNDEIKYVSVQNGLPDHIVHWISEDEYGFLWLLSNKGVTRINKKDLNDYMDGATNNFQLAHFDRSEGMRSPEGNGSFQEAGIKTRDGKFWFATQEGVAIFDRQDVNDNQYFPTLVVENIMANDSVYAIDSTRTITLAKGVGVFEINYQAITFINPDQIKLRYKLKGLQNKWIETRQRKVMYSDLSPGSYEFMFQATNSEGVWCDEIGSVYIQVQARFYQKVWFYIIIAIIVVAIFYITIRLSNRILISRQAKMQALIDNQTEQIRREKNALEVQKKVIEDQATHLEEANKTKDRFFSIIAHDLRNPFQAMIGYSDILYHRIDDIDKDELKEGIQIIRDSSKTLHNLTENLLSWASLQTGKVTAEPTKFVINEIILENRELFLQASQQKGIKIIVDAKEEIQVYADQNMTHTIIRNVLSNAIKFTNKLGEVQIKAEKYNGMCSISITDNGVGMNSKSIAGILDLDSNLSRLGTEDETGSGLGLILCNEMVQMNNGSLKIESVEGKGTTITILLPTKP